MKKLYKYFTNNVKENFMLHYQSIQSLTLQTQKTKHYYSTNHQLFINLIALAVMHLILEKQNTYYKKER